MHAKSQEVELNNILYSWPCLSIDLGPFWSQPPSSLDKLNSKDCIGITLHLIWKSRMSWLTTYLQHPNKHKQAYLNISPGLTSPFMQPKTKSPFQIHPQISPLKPWHLGFQGAKQGLLGAQDLHGAGGVLGQIRQAAWLFGMLFQAKNMEANKHNICRTPAWEINRAPMISPIRAAKFGATKSILASAWRQDAYSRLAGHWHWCSLYCCFKAPLWNCNSWMTRTRKLEFCWNRPSRYSKFLWAVALKTTTPLGHTDAIREHPAFK